MAEQPSFPSPNRDAAAGAHSGDSFFAAPQETDAERAARELFEQQAAYRQTHPQAARPVRRRQGPRRGLIIGGGVAVALLLGLGSGAAWAVTGHGDYAYDHVASGASIYAQVNLDPSMLQKVQMISFLSKLPNVNDQDVQDKASNPDSIAKLLLDRVAPNNGVTDYSWAGDRYAIVGYGDGKSLETSKYGIVIQVKDQDRAIMVLRAALANRKTGMQLAALDQDYVVLGDADGIKAITAPGKNLGDDADFKRVYTEGEDPLSYWGKTDKANSAGGVRAGWGSLQLTGDTVGMPLGVTEAASEQNLRLTGQNSVANPLLNFGLAEPSKQFGPNSPFGQQLLAASGVTGDADQKQLKTIVDALGDNLSVSANSEGGRLLLHGANEKKVDAAVSEISGERTTLKEMLASSADEGDQYKIENTAQGLAVTIGNVKAAPTTLNHVTAGSAIGQFDFSHLPKQLVDTDTSKLGSISFSTTSTADGSKVQASWDLP